MKYLIDIFRRRGEFDSIGSKVESGEKNALLSRLLQRLEKLLIRVQSNQNKVFDRHVVDEANEIAEHFFLHRRATQTSRTLRLLLFECNLSGKTLKNRAKKKKNSERERNLVYVRDLNAANDRTMDGSRTMDLFFECELEFAEPIP